MNRKRSIQLALGIILIIVLIVGGAVYFMTKNNKTADEKVVEEMMKDVSTEELDAMAKKIEEGNLGQ